MYLRMFVLILIFSFSISSNLCSQDKDDEIQQSVKKAILEKFKEKGCARWSDEWREKYATEISRYFVKAMEKIGVSDKILMAKMFEYSFVPPRWRGDPKAEYEYPPWKEEDFLEILKEHKFRTYIYIKKKNQPFFMDRDLG